MKNWSQKDIDNIQSKGRIKRASPPLPVLPVKYDYYIGIDTGVNTGYAIYKRSNKTLISVESIMIHQALYRIRDMHRGGVSLFVRVEDARKGVFGHNTEAGKAKQQGAGSVKRDAKIWEDFLTDLKIPHEMCRANKRISKLDAAAFAKITKYTHSTNQHGRDAAMLVYNF